MLTSQKVVWNEGMFLQPQHFQQSERFILDTMNARIDQYVPYSYGIGELEIDPDSCANGSITIKRCSGVLPDGTVFSIPKTDTTPASRRFVDYLSHDRASLDVYLALSISIAGSANIYSDTQATGSGDTQSRYISQTVMVTDEVLGESKKEILVASPRFMILFDGESLDGTAALPIGKLVRNSMGQVEFSTAFIPPLLSIGASPSLQSGLRGLLELLHAKSSALSQGRRQNSKGIAEFTGSEETAFRMLQTINTFLPLLSHYYAFPVVHPFELFKILSQFTGALTTFSTEVGISSLPRYEHARPAQTFDVFTKLIRSIIETGVSAGSVSIPVEKAGNATYLCKVLDESLLTSGRFYFGVSAKVSEKELIVGVLQRIKMCSSASLDMLIASAMPGIGLIHTMNAPEGLSVRPGYVYFKINQAGDYWDNIKATKTIAFYFPNSYPDVKLEMLALRD